jgi:prepilin-type N-terminal cleavage/methylation domain-containing protein
MRRNPRSGVTLLELLIALWVMAAAAVILASTLGLAGRALARVGTEAREIEAITARLTLRRWLEAMPLQARLSGDDAGMTFGALIDQAPLTAAQVTEVRVSGAGGTIEADAAGGAIVVTLAADGALVALRYYGAAVPGDSPAWRPDWPANAVRLPELVQISYASRGRDVPALTVIPARLARQSEMSLSSP